MNAELKRRWIKNLRSGKYAKCTTDLHNVKGYCALGVYLDTIDPNKWVWRGENKNYHWQGFISILPIDVNFHKSAIIAKMSDEGATFDKVADFIETNIPED